MRSPLYAIVVLVIVVLVAFLLTILWDALNAPSWLDTVTYVGAVLAWLFWLVGGRLGTRTRL